MQLHCKQCNTKLTNSLFPTKWKRKIKELNYYGKGIHQISYSISKGGFTKSNHMMLGTIFNSYAVDRTSLLIPIPTYARGIGCCDVDGEYVSCTCGSILGVMSYDCWQTYHAVDLNRDKVYFKKAGK